MYSDEEKKRQERDWGKTCAFVMHISLIADSGHYIKEPMSERHFFGQEKCQLNGAYANFLRR